MMDWYKYFPFYITNVAANDTRSELGRIFVVLSSPFFIRRTCLLQNLLPPKLFAAVDRYSRLASRFPP